MTATQTAWVGGKNICGTTDKAVSKKLDDRRETNLEVLNAFCARDLESDSARAAFSTMITTVGPD